MLCGGGRGLSEGFRDAFGSVEGRPLACSKFLVQGSKLLGLRLEKSFESGVEKTPLNYLMPFLGLFRTDSCSPIG